MSVKKVGGVSLLLFLLSACVHSPACLDTSRLALQWGDAERQAKEAIRNCYQEDDCDRDKVIEAVILARDLRDKTEMEAKACLGILGKEKTGDGRSST